MTQENQNNQDNNQDVVVNKSEEYEVDGIVEEALPSATFRVKLNNDSVILAHLSGKMRLHYIRVLPGDKVVVKMSPYDKTKGRIIKRLK